MRDAGDRGRDLAGLRQRLRALRLSDFDAWILYLRCGGAAMYLEFEAYLWGALITPRLEWSALEQGVWEAENF